MTTILFIGGDLNGEKLKTNRRFKDYETLVVPAFVGKELKDCRYCIQPREPGKIYGPRVATPETQTL